MKTPWASSSADVNWHALTEVNIMPRTIGGPGLSVRSDKPFLSQGAQAMQDPAGSDGEGSAGPSTRLLSRRSKRLSTAKLRKLKLFKFTLLASVLIWYTTLHKDSALSKHRRNICCTRWCWSYRASSTFTCTAGALTNYKLTFQSRFLVLGACETAILNEQ